MATNYTRSIGVSLKQTEIRRIQDQANALGVSRNSLMRWALLYALDQIEAGKAQPQVEREVKTKLRMPGF